MYISTLSLCKAIDVTHKHMVLIDTINHIAISMRIPTRKIGSPNACVRHRRAHVCARARAGACEYGRPRNPRRTCERFPSASTASGFGSQAFGSATAFNANIGAWNTASVTKLNYVCAAFGPGGVPPRAPQDGARPVFDAARPVVRGGTADARRRIGTRLRGRPRV